MWDLTEAVQLCRSIEQVAHLYGCHVALAGSVLYRGSSNKDLDIICYPHQAPKPIDIQGFQDALGAAGINGWSKFTFYADEKNVWEAKYGARRIDFFFMAS